MISQLAEIIISFLFGDHYFFLSEDTPTANTAARADFAIVPAVSDPNKYVIGPNIAMVGTNGPTIPPPIMPAMGRPIFVVYVRSCLFISAIVATEITNPQVDPMPELYFTYVKNLLVNNAILSSGIFDKIF
jgi:hypothetical protein